MSDHYERDERGQAPDPEPGKRKKKAKPQIWVDPDPADSPAIPLGYQGREVVFALPGGELRYEAAKNIAGMLKTDIYVCLAGQKFLSNWRPEDGDLNLQQAAIWFVRQCRDAGKWDKARPVRGYGVWPSAEGPVLHAGDALGQWPFREWTPVAEALRRGGRGPVWKLAPPAPRPQKASSVEDGRTLKAHLDRWKWKPLADGAVTGPDIVIGWLGQALLGACAPFRTHLLCTGGFGCGKTTLSELMQAAGSANGGELLDSFTEAGLRGGISGEARAVFLDEAEPNPDGPGPVEKALEMLRRMSTGDGSNRLQGDKGGETLAQTAVGAAWLGAIVSVELNGAMASRVVEVKLRPLGAAKGEAAAEIEAAKAWAKGISPSLLARAMRDFGRYKADVSMLKSAFGQAGLMHRGADLYAALAAGRRLLLEDEPLTAETVKDELDLWTPLITRRDATSSTKNMGQACLERIFSIDSSQYKSDRRLTIGELIEEAAVSPGMHDKVLKAFGLRVERQDGRCFLWVANNHPGLAKALAQSEFRNWRSALEQLEDLGPQYEPRTLGHPPKFGLHQSRALSIPLAPWLENTLGVAPAIDLADDAFKPDWDRASPVSSPEAYPEQTHE